MSSDWVEDILQLHKAYRQLVQRRPGCVYYKTRDLRLSVIKEETRELIDAMHTGNLVKIADGIADSIVVLLGTAASYGINMKPIWDIVQKANMAKVGGPVRADGKQLKPKGWQPPEPAIGLELCRQWIEGCWT